VSLHHFVFKPCHLHGIDVERGTKGAGVGEGARVVVAPQLLVLSLRYGIEEALLQMLLLVMMILLLLLKLLLLLLMMMMLLLVAQPEKTSSHSQMPGVGFS